jgi:16S rRNA (cytidine1402-2'-O)-methyltransferase
MIEHDKQQATGCARLYVVATPIGNLQDITLRALEILREVSLVYAEDTRTTGVLFAQHGIATKMRALHDHNEARVAADVIDVLRSGRSVALVSDAGTPAISDPGAIVVAQAREAGFAVQAVPGANAAVAAISISGMPGPFCFVGFLPPKSVARRAALEHWRDFQHSVVLYEAPHRVIECVEDIAAICGGERPLLIARELTKLFETTHRCTAGEASRWLQADANRQRGEFVLVIGAAPAHAERADIEADRVLKLLLEELPLKQAAKLAAAISGARKNELYERALSWRRDDAAQN